MTRAQLLRTFAVLLLGLASACDPSDPCDSGYYEEHGACYPVRMPAGDGGGDGDGDADEDAGADPSDAATSGDPYEGFGDECSEAEPDCPNGLVCAAPQLPYCTQVNCLSDDSICPPDWTCYDAMGASPDPSVTSACVNF